MARAHGLDPALDSENLALLRCLFKVFFLCFMDTFGIANIVSRWDNHEEEAEDCSEGEEDSDSGEAEEDDACGGDWGSSDSAQGGNGGAMPSVGGEVVITYDAVKDAIQRLESAPLGAYCVYGEPESFITGGGMDEPDSDPQDIVVAESLAFAQLVPLHIRPASTR